MGICDAFGIVQPHKERADQSRAYCNSDSFEILHFTVRQGEGFSNYWYDISKVLSTCECMTFAKTLRPFTTNAADVSSHEVSMPNMIITSYGGYGSMWVAEVMGMIPRSHFLSDLFILLKAWFQAFS